MSQEPFFTDDEVAEKAKKVANGIMSDGDYDVAQKLFVKSGEWSKGLLA